MLETRTHHARRAAPSDARSCPGPDRRTEGECPTAATIHPGLRLFVRKLERRGPLTEEERRTLEDLPLSVRRVDADRDLVRDGQRPSHRLLLLEGFCCRYKVLADGGWQITAFHIPGDILDLTGLLLGRMDHGIGTLTPARVAPIPHAALLDWIGRHPGLARLLWQDTMVDAAVFGEWWSTSAAVRPANASPTCCASW